MDSVLHFPILYIIVRKYNNYFKFWWWVSSEVSSIKSAYLSNFADLKYIILTLLVYNVEESNALTC